MLSRLMMIRIGLLGYAAAQLGTTLINRNFWPFCSYNMFNAATTEDRELHAHLKTPEGWTEAQRPDRLIPVPFFRATAILDFFFVREHSDAEATIMSQSILRRLNAGRWRAFDEVRAATQVARPVCGLRVCVSHPTDGPCAQGADVVVYEYDGKADENA